MGNTDDRSGDNELMTSKQVMEYLQVKRTKLWSLIKNHGLPHFTLGGVKGDYRFRKSEIVKWLDEQRQQHQKSEEKSSDNDQ